MTSIFSQRRIFHYTLLLLFLVVLFTSGCAVTIPSGEEYLLLSNAKITPEIISDDGSLITIEYSKTTTFRDREKLLLGYFVSTKRLEKRPGAIIGEGVICYLLLSNLNANLANETGVIKFPITNIFHPISKDWWARHKIYEITGKMHSADFVKFQKNKKYVGNTTISIFLSVDGGQRISNVLIVPVSFK